MAAKNYEEILALVNAGNQMGLSNTIKRDYGIPLDFTSVQPSLAAAIEYAATNTKAYVGQPLSVGSKLYIITDSIQPAFEGVETEFDNYLAEVGSKTEGDGATIDLEDGVLKLYGIDLETTVAGMLPQVEVVDGQKRLKWVAISSIVEGDGNKITTLTSEDGSVTITKKTDTEESLVYDLSVTHPDVPEYAVAADEREEGATSTTYRLTKDGEAVEAAIVVPDAYDDSVLAGRVKAIEDDYLKAEDKYDDKDLQDRVAAIEGDYLKEADKYDDTEVRELIADLDEAIGDATGGLVKDIADEVARATAKEEELAAAIEAIDFIDQGELDAALAPINTALGTKAAQTDLEALEDRVDAFLTGTGTEAALDSLKELIEYIDAHDGADLTEMIATINAIEGKLEGIDSTVAAYVTAAIEALKIGDYAKAADLTALAGRVEALEAKPFDTYATKSEVETVDAKFADYTKTSDLNTALAGKVDNDTFAQFKADNTAAIEAAQAAAVAAAKTETETQVGALEESVAETYATKQSVTDLGNTISATLNDYAKTAYVETELGKKANSADVYTRTEVDNKIGTPGVPAVTDEDGNEVTPAVQGTGVFANAYSRAEIDKLLDEVQGGSSASADSVLRQLNTYKSTNDERVKAVEDKNATQDTAIEAAQAQADKGVADAKTANDAITALTNGAVATNTSDITAIKTRLTTLETAKGDHETRLGNAEGKINALEAADVVINQTLGTIEGNITALQNKDAEIAGQIAALQNGKADASSVYTKTETDKAIEDAIKAIPAVDLSKHATIEYVDGELAKKADASSVYTKDEADAAFMNQDEVDARINALIVAADPEGGKTIENIQNLVKYVDDNAGEIAELITVTNNNTAKLEGIDTTVTDYVSSAIAALVMPKGSEEVTFAEDGTLGLGKVSTDKLVQGTETLVIDGGSSAL